MPTTDWQEQFDALVERKTREALASVIAPLVTARDQADDRVAVIGNAWSRAMFGGLFYVTPSSPGDLPSTNLVFVQSRDGNTVTDDPSTLGGGNADAHLIYEGLTRVAVDAVLAGSRTVRRRTLFSVWRPELVALRATMDLPRHPVQIVATLDGIALDEALMFNVPELPVILITVARGAEAMRDALKTRSWIRLVVMENALDLPAAFRELRRLGFDRVSCVGGRTLARQLLDAGLIQDVYLTTGTNVGGAPGTPFYDKPLQGREIVRKNGTGADAGVTFQHIAI